MTLFSIVKNASNTVDSLETHGENTGVQNRTLYSILASLMSEVGELSDEIVIDQNHSSRLKGKDGIVGEAVDIILCALDIIHEYDYKIDENTLEEVALRKTNKWINNVKYNKGVLY